MWIQNYQSLRTRGDKAGGKGRMEMKVGWRVGNSHWEWMGSGGTYRWAIKEGDGRKDGKGAKWRTRSGVNTKRFLVKSGREPICVSVGFLELTDNK